MAMTGQHTASDPGAMPTDASAPAFDVVCFGEPMYEFSQIPGKSREYLQGVGGDTMNCAIAASRQGARVAYVCRIGEDAFGREMPALCAHPGPV